jgi:predicted secreted hydrolase
MTTIHAKAQSHRKARKAITALRALRLPSRLCVRLLVLLACVTLAPAQTDDGWRRAAPDYDFAFPRDHESHPEYKIEWWYYTGNLAAADGRRYGYQLTFFRIGVDPNPKNPSRWAVRDLFMTHLAVTDVAGGAYRFRDRMNRAGVGWAGAATDRYRVWNEDWEARLDPATGRHILSAAEDGVGVDLELEPLKPPVLHGARGYSQKGSDPGNASNYYSLTRIATRGTVTVDGRAVPVEGLSWMDHEFGTSFLEPEQQGWDWFSIQLDDGTDLMVFQLRRKDGSRDARSSGTLVDASGAAVSVAPDELDLAPGRVWRSPASGAAYPTEWRVRVPSRGLDLTVRAALDDQELRTERSAGVAYWEGAVTIEGTRDGRPVAGRGYLEMTGYVGEAMGEIMR